MASIVGVGAGLAGRACAWKLRRAGHQVELLDAGSAASRVAACAPAAAGAAPAAPTVPLLLVARLLVALTDRRLSVLAQRINPQALAIRVRVCSYSECRSSKPNQLAFAGLSWLLQVWCPQVRHHRLPRNRLPDDRVQRCGVRMQPIPGARKSDSSALPLPNSMPY